MPRIKKEKIILAAAIMIVCLTLVLSIFVTLFAARGPVGLPIVGIIVIAITALGAMTGSRLVERAESSSRRDDFSEDRDER